MKNLVNDIGKKKLLIILAGIVGFIVLIIVFLLIYNSLFVKTSYKDIENKILVAAQKYYKDNPTLLPKDDTQEVSITDKTLTSAGYLKSMNELTKDIKNANCNASVMINYAGGDYRYTVLLDCGENYSTKTLVSYIKNNVEKVTSGAGLYNLNGELVYRGENPNNFVKFSGKTWRIVKIENDKAVLILNEKNERTVWDDRFNTERNRTDGINDYNVSRIYETLNNIYIKEELITSSNKKLLSSFVVYTGKRLAADAYNDGSIEKSTFLNNQYIGLLPLYDYLNASVDTNCLTSLTASCTNYNYLNHYEYSWWTVTADAANTYKAYRVSSTGEIDLIKAATNGYVRPVVHLAKDVIYNGGDGTEQNPFIIK